MVWVEDDVAVELQWPRPSLWLTLSSEWEDSGLFGRGLCIKDGGDTGVTVDGDVATGAYIPLAAATLVASPEAVVAATAA